jgi:hypothetical protein
MCTCLPQHPWLFIFSSQGHDRQSSDENFLHKVMIGKHRNKTTESWSNKIFFLNYSYVVHTEYIYIIFHQLNSAHERYSPRKSSNLVSRAYHLHYCTGKQNYLRQIFCDLLLKSAFERIFNVMQLILVKIKWRIKWKYLIQKFHDICLSYYLKKTNYLYSRGHFVLFNANLFQILRKQHPVWGHVRLPSINTKVQKFNNYLIN